MFLLSILVTLFVAQVRSQFDPVKNHTKGYCVWYGQCTTGSHAMNCLYNGPAKSLVDPEGVELLNNICPELRGQPTCCDTKQLQALKTNLQTIQQVTSRCPACWNNMRRLYCQLTCNKDQSLYMDPSFVLGNIIEQIKYYVSPTVKQGLFNSCKDVKFHGFEGKLFKVLDLLCGTSAEMCTPQELLTYMGSTSNGFAPFTIHYPKTLAPHLSWMNITIFKCNESFIDPQSNKTTKPCSCQDCFVPSSCPVPPAPPLHPTFNPFFYRTEQLIIRPTHPVPTGYHRYGDGKWIPFGPIFHLDLLNQALDLQKTITNMKVPFGSGYITLEDICFQPSAPQSKQCNIQSVFQYFQNNKTKLNKCLTSMDLICSDETLQYDVKAYDFHDHILFCTSFPLGSWDEELKGPCIGAFGGPVEPRVVLDDFGGTAYQNATTLIIKFVVNNHTDKRKLEKPLAWEKAFIEFMKTYVENPKNSNLTISFSTPRAPPNEPVREGDTESILVR